MVHRYIRKQIVIPITSQQPLALTEGHLLAPVVQAEPYSNDVIFCWWLGNISSPALFVDFHFEGENTPTIMKSTMSNLVCMKCLYSDHLQL